MQICKCKFETANLKVQTANCKMQNANCKLKNALETPLQNLDHTRTLAFDIHRAGRIIITNCNF